MPPATPDNWRATPNTQVKGLTITCDSRAGSPDALCCLLKALAHVTYVHKNIHLNLNKKIFKKSTTGIL